MLHDFLLAVATPMISIIEIIGLIFLIVAFLMAIYHLAVVDKFNFQKFNKRPDLRSGMITSLEILMVAEIIKTMTSVTIEHVIIVALLVAVRLFMTHVLEQEIERHVMSFSETDESETVCFTKPKSSKDED